MTDNDIDAEHALRVERCLAPVDLKTDGFGWRVASPAFVDRWKRDEAELIARGYHGLWNKFGDLLVSCWPIAQQLIEATETPPFIETVDIIDPETDEISSTPPQGRRRRRKHNRSLRPEGRAA